MALENGSSSSSSSIFSLVVYALLALAGVHLALTWKKLSSIPGPFLCSLSNFPRLFWVYKRQPYYKHIELHKKYGKLVRMGPNMVSVSSPADIPTIYGFNYDFNKSDFYTVMLPYMNGQPIPGTIAFQDADLHKKMKKPVVQLFSTSALLSYESYVNSSIELLNSRFAELYAQSGKRFNFGNWVEWFIFDTLGELTFSKKYGFLEKGTDVDNIIRDNSKHFDYVSLIGMIPWVDNTLKFGPLWSRLFKAPDAPQMNFQFARMGERQALMESGAKMPEGAERDLMTKFFQAQGSDPTLPPWSSVMWIATNIGAGSGTTATLIRAAFYHLLKNRATLDKLVKEISAASIKPGDIPSYKQTQSLPYLDAVVREAERLHPSVGLPLERTVPPQGATIAGKFFEGGTVVGINPWVVHRDTDVFGKDAEKWNPERWLVGGERRKAMEAANLNYGAGSRVCYGKNFAHLIAFKAIPAILAKFEIELAEPQKEWTDQGRWFVSQEDFYAKVRLRG